MREGGGCDGAPRGGRTQGVLKCSFKEAKAGSGSAGPPLCPHPGSAALRLGDRGWEHGRAPGPPRPGLQLGAPGPAMVRDARETRRSLLVGARAEKPGRWPEPARTRRGSCPAARRPAVPALCRGAPPPRTKPRPAPNCNSGSGRRAATPWPRIQVRGSNARPCHMLWQPRL